MTDYEVGYGKPPRHTRFKPGRSGNPKGRSKGSRNLKTDLAEELEEKIAIKEGGKYKKVTKQRAMLKILMAKAVQGNLRAASAIISMMLKLLNDDIESTNELDLSEADTAILKRFEDKVIQMVKERG